MTIFVNWAFPATGTGMARRTMPDRLADIKNVLDFGAYNDGTNGAATTAAIQAAIDAELANVSGTGVTTGIHGTVYFPPGTYTITSSLTLNHVGETSIKLIGEGRASFLSANFAGFVIDRNLPGEDASVGPITIDHFYIANQHASGGCIRLGNAISAAVRNCILTGVQGIWFVNEDYEPSYSVLAENVNIQSAGASSATRLTGNGVVIGGNGMVNACDISGVECAVRVFGSGASFLNTRIERNVIGVMTGLYPDGTDATCTSFVWQGGSTESNLYNLDMYNTSGFVISAIGGHGGASPWPPGSTFGPTTISNDINGVTWTGTATAAGVMTVTGASGTIPTPPPGGAVYINGTGVSPGAKLSGQLTSTGGSNGTWSLNHDTIYYLRVNNSCSNGVFLGWIAGEVPQQYANYIADTTNRADLVFVACQGQYRNDHVFHNGLGWRFPATAHTATFINCNTVLNGTAVTDTFNTYTYSGLPTGANVREGDEYTINDAATGNCSDAACNWGANVTGGGGALNRMVRYNGTNWTVVGK